MMMMMMMLSDYTFSKHSSFGIHLVASRKPSKPQRPVTISKIHAAHPGHFELPVGRFEHPVRVSMLVRCWGMSSMGTPKSFQACDILCRLYKKSSFIGKSIEISGFLGHAFNLECFSIDIPWDAANTPNDRNMWPFMESFGDDKFLLTMRILSWSTKNIDYYCQRLLLVLRVTLTLTLRLILILILILLLLAAITTAATTTAKLLPLLLTRATKDSIVQNW